MRPRHALRGDRNHSWRRGNAPELPRTSLSGGGSTNTLDMLRLSPSRGPVPPMDWIGRANAGSRLDLRPTGPRKLTRPAWSPTAAIRPYPSTAAKLWPRVRPMPRAPRLKLRAAKLPGCYATPVAGFGVRPCVSESAVSGATRCHWQLLLNPAGAPRRILFAILAYHGRQPQYAPEHASTRQSRSGIHILANSDGSWLL